MRKYQNNDLYEILLPALETLEANGDIRVTTDRDKVIETLLEHLERSGRLNDQQLKLIVRDSKGRVIGLQG